MRVPDAAKAHTEAGAIEFAKFVVNQADLAYVNVDDSVIKTLSGPSCEGCDVTIKGVADQKAAGERQVAPSLTILATNVLPSQNPDAYDVQVQVRSEKVDIVDTKGKTVNSTQAGKGVYRVATRWDGKQWTVADMGVE
ncbi:hypothetical protein BCF74_1335 [Knoellia remsis]|uniref:DUF6318 domain-containing protein n=1 Tax=Knoellia remsis TaxID=407159 RepID=A0A2T0U3I7_9MICO|nr:DUF6318 family protein [Knoellia remsis]PRY52476.1 hypothetical protein BCF74_1335 [Knoellia remsis]